MTTDRLLVSTVPASPTLPSTLAGAIRFTLARAGDSAVRLRNGAGVLFAPAQPDTDGRMRPRTLMSPSITRIDTGWEIRAVLADEDGTPLTPPTDVSFLSSDLLDWTPPRLAPADDCGTASQSVEIDSDVSQALLARFGRVHSTAIRADEEGPLAERGATVTYSDGSTRRVRVDWQCSDQGERAEGRVQTLDLRFPWIADRADPQVSRFDGKWYFVGTPDAGRGNEGTPALYIRGADSLADLVDAADVPLAEIGESDIGGCFWAPEMHVIGGQLRLLFAPSINTASWNGVQAHIMTLRSGGNPLVRDDWSRPEPVLNRDGGLLRVDDRHGVSLDMTYFSDGNDGFYVWSQRVAEDDFVSDAELWIARVDPTRPTRLRSEPRVLHTGATGWELTGANVVEGPYLLAHGADLHLIYAAAAVGPHYATGALHAKRGSDLGDPASWSALPHPLLDSWGNEHQWGPGHVSFFTDDTGEDFMAFHAKTQFDEQARHTGIRRVHWAADGRPVLDMTADEDVHPTLRNVTTPRLDLP